MRLLVVTQDFPPAVGGIQTYSWELARRWASSAEALRVVAPTHDGADAVDASAPFDVTRVPGRPDLLPLTALPVVPRLARRMPAAVAFHAQWQTVGASALARAWTGWPQRIVCAAHGRELLLNPLDSLPGLTDAYARLRRWTLQQVDRFVPVSRYTAGLLYGLGVERERLHVVPNGTDPERFQPRDASALRARLGLDGHATLLTVGRLVQRKGIDTVLHALSSVADAVPSVRYLVVGTGPDRDRLERLARRLGVAERVCFAGRVPHADLARYYSAADLFVMPSREEPPDVEGFGLVFLEANACGVPVVGARSGGVPDAVQHEHTGLLVPPADPKALATAICRVLTRPEWAAALGANGRRRAAGVASWDRIAERILSLLVDTTPRAA